MNTGRVSASPAESSPAPTEISRLYCRNRRGGRSAENAILRSPRRRWRRSTAQPQGGYSMQPQDLGKRLFTFAVIADSHLNQDELDCNSPFPVNKLANRRMRHVVRDLNRRDVAFVSIWAT